MIKLNSNPLMNYKIEKKKKQKILKKGKKKSLHDSLTNIQSTRQACNPDYRINCFTFIFLLLCNKKNIKVIYHQPTTKR